METGTAGDNYFMLDHCAVPVPVQPLWLPVLMIIRSPRLKW
jgi:hypothetical protein